MNSTLGRPNSNHGPYNSRRINHRESRSWMLALMRRPGGSIICKKMRSSGRRGCSRNQTVDGSNLRVITMCWLVVIEILRSWWGQLWYGVTRQKIYHHRHRRQIAFMVHARDRQVKPWTSRLTLPERMGWNSSCHPPLSSDISGERASVSEIFTRAPTRLIVTRQISMQSRHESSNCLTS